MIGKMLGVQTSRVSSIAILLAASFFLSRILGVWRDRLLAGRFGAGSDLDIYFAAFRIPDFIYAVFIAGGLTAVFLPIFSEYFRKDEKEAWRITSSLFYLVSLGMLILSVILIIAMPFLVGLITPGFSPEMRKELLPLANLMLLSPIILGISGVLSGVIQYFNRFFAYALAPIMYNLGIIGGILFLEPSFGLKGVVWGVVIGTVLHSGIQLYPAFRSGFRLHGVLDLKHPAITQALWLMAPRTLGAAAYNLNITIVTAIASTLSAGSIAIFNFANNLHFFPVTLIGVSLGTAVFPALSRNHAEGDSVSFARNFSSGFRQILFLTMPPILLLFILRFPVIDLLLKTGKFDALSARLTAATLGIFAFGIFSQVFIPYLIRVFFALKDTKMPTVIGIVSVAVNIVLVLLFLGTFSSSNAIRNFFSRFLGLGGIDDIRILALPLSLAVSSFFSFFFLSLALARKAQRLFRREIMEFAKKVFAASLVLIVSTTAFLQISDTFFDRTSFLGLLEETALAALVGGGMYLVTLILLKSSEAQGLIALLKSFFKKT